MRIRPGERRTAVFALAVATLRPSLVLASRPRLNLVTGTLPPLTSSPGRIGFLDALTQDFFGRVGLDVTLSALPFERALINVNAGFDDGDPFRASGFENDYPNLLRIPERVMDLDFVAYAANPKLQIHEWSDLTPHSVAYVTGWKIFERHVKAAREITTVRGLELLFPLLAAGRVDVVLVDRWQGLWLAAQAKLAVKAPQAPLARVAMYTYLHRRHEALISPLADALAEVKRDGTWQRLYDQILRPLEAVR